MLTADFQKKKKKSHIAHCSGKDEFIDYCRKEGSYTDRVPVASLKGKFKDKAISNFWAVWLRNSFYTKY